MAKSAGDNQTTYKGWPLYYYAGDENPGDTTGEGIQKIWFVARYPFYSIIVMSNSGSGAYLANSNGMPLYYYKSDTQGTATTDPKTTCTGECLRDWQIFDEKNITAPSLLSVGDFSEFKNADNGNQLAYKGRPLYVYSGDINPGDINGDELEKLWYLVRP